MLNSEPDSVTITDGVRDDGVIFSVQLKLEGTGAALLITVPEEHEAIVAVASALDTIVDNIVRALNDAHTLAHATTELNGE